ncbi:hypothetical protein Mapa_003136 [Marchantia paleacea]|nr:hypothetical protein Mapa_003136 [Marchantia paleacea]
MDRVSRKSLVGDAVGSFQHSCYPGPGGSHGNFRRPRPFLRSCLQGGRPCLIRSINVLFRRPSELRSGLLYGIAASSPGKRFTKSAILLLP